MGEDWTLWLPQSSSDGHPCLLGGGVWMVVRAPGPQWEEMAPGPSLRACTLQRTQI